MVPKLIFYSIKSQHNDDPILSLGVQTKYTLHSFLIFLLLCSHYIADLRSKNWNCAESVSVSVDIKSLKSNKSLKSVSVLVSVLRNIKFGNSQISLPKIGMLMSKAACVNPN